MKIRIGTRTSLMAMAQARTVARLLHEHYPHLETEFVGIVPVGDKDKTTPLPEMNTIGIFSKEIDDRLLAGEIDCAVHSLKDLGTIRPTGIARAAVLKRDNIRDIILFHPDILDRLRTGKNLRIGTSAPRRAELLPDFLKKALPALGNTTPEIELVSIRGNANTRIAKLKDDTQNLDAIVLALGGLGRLYGDNHSREQLIALLSNLKRMVVPITICPPAPGQGTICIEALSGRKDMLEILHSFNDAPTERAIDNEFSVLTGNGGGCHQRFGVASIPLNEINDNILLVRGKNKDGIDISATRWTAPAISAFGNIWNGQQYAGDIFAYKSIQHEKVSAQAIFIAHHRAWPETSPDDARLWVSGTPSWFKLAAAGHWVEGCADGFGFDYIEPTLCEPVLQLPPLNDWDILSHKHAQNSWKTGRFVATYSHEAKSVSLELQKALQDADIFWWSSASQYQALRAYVNPQAKAHFCGPGKTAETLAAEGVKPLYVCPDNQSFIRWTHDKRATQSATGIATAG